MSKVRVARRRVISRLLTFRLAAALLRNHAARKASRVLLSDFDYHHPAELIAQEPPPDRAASRMLVLDRKSAT